MTTTVRDVVIIGGGISGTAAAYELSRSGATVTLVEKGGLASMASGWTLAGVRQSGRHPAELPLARAAVGRWENLGQELGADIEYRQEGNLRLARTPEEVEVIQRIVAEQQALGLDLSFCPDNASVRAIAPALSEAALAASYCPTDGHANPIATVQAYAAAAERAGARILTRTAATKIELAGGRVSGVQTTAGPIVADVVVVAAGVYSDRLCAVVGLTWPLAVVHVSVVQTVPLPPLIKQVLGVANADLAGRQEVGGAWRMTASTGPWAWPEGDLRPEQIQPPARMVAALVDRAGLVLPAIAEAGLARVWGGLIDMTPDGLPVIERCPEVEGLVIAAGFSGHGFCLGPITGQLVGELVAGQEPSLPLAPFRRERFASQSGKAPVELHG
jgi:sarcosine oxidase, subunit beta